LDKEHFFGGLKVLIKFADIGVMEGFHAFYLTIHCVFLRLVIQLEFRVNLNGHLLLGRLVNGILYLSVCSFAQFPNNLVVI
jgi:hypothetical protein